MSRNISNLARIVEEHENSKHTSRHKFEQSNIYPLECRLENAASRSRLIKKSKEKDRDTKLKVMGHVMAYESGVVCGMDGKSMGIGIIPWRVIFH